ncbi:MAG: BCAM0308 family protein [candidate division WOR-3 bacterium]|nr:BCAM0308 family protein [candidate division WOR-3 bacterium]MDH5683128.1 BCAM0308 family protein [candidate division WOR-3 bacterium]
MPVNRGKARSGPRPKLDDPYLTRKAYPEPTICPVCGLIYHNKRWAKDDHIFEAVKDVAQKHKCPSCRKIEDHFVMGMVSISSESDFIDKHKTEIINLIHNEEKRELLRNPLDRIMSLKEKGNELNVETTSENLAVAIGKAMHRAYNGEVEFRFSRNNKQARVYWKR